jgi:hypothetical protein
LHGDYNIYYQDVNSVPELLEQRMAALHYLAFTAIEVAQFLLYYKTDVIVAKEGLSGKGPGYTFAYVGVETIKKRKVTL